MKELMKNLKNTCENAKAFIVGKLLEAVIMICLTLHFVSIGGFWGIAATVYCTLRIIVAARGLIKIIKFHMDDFYLDFELL